ncbi:MAG: flavin monoamine oxidase family protein [Roseobacter sp.]
MRQTEIAIIGGGLAGLALADQLHREGREFVMLEARNRFGGRILSHPQTQNGFRYDLGPAWIWPHNTRILSLLQRLGLEAMPQHADGLLIYQDRFGEVRRDVDFATMGDALRIKGSAAAIIDRLVESLPPDALVLNAPVTTVSLRDEGIVVSSRINDQTHLLAAQHVALTMPPRLIASSLSFEPPLSAMTLLEMASTPTWMAGHAKAVAVYDRAFWRANGQSGDAISHLGPLMEIHDASATQSAEGEAALFGFLRPGLIQKSPSVEHVKQAILAQLEVLFGATDARLSAFYLMDWSGEIYTATKEDFRPLAQHPAYQPLRPLGLPWEDKLILSGSEVAPREGGFLEGALEAAARTADILGRAAKSG